MSGFTYMIKSTSEVQKIILENGKKLEKAIALKTQETRSKAIVIAKKNEKLIKQKIEERKEAQRQKQLIQERKEKCRDTFLRKSSLQYQLEQLKRE